MYTCHAKLGPNQFTPNPCIQVIENYGPNQLHDYKPIYANYILFNNFPNLFPQHSHVIRMYNST